ncbi:uncharacterized protein LOC111463059 [Cucurbita moschata]|uniref:Uncharacterized protein LOC111463059 n=1 Tax=Cucurbita moschata TaxID=3662 RepID=A0A6J1HDT6_CUCMO|nr:uncharacterized protein LOC111463059 [Cucurbita moschata]
MWFGKKGKLSPRFIGPFEILDRVGAVTYRIALPSNLAVVHNVFHVSMLRRYTPYPTHVIEHETLPLREDLSYEERPSRILARDTKRLCNKVIPLVKVAWGNHRNEEATWEQEDDGRSSSDFVRKSDETSRFENLSKNGKDVIGLLSDAHNSLYD